MTLLDVFNIFQVMIDSGIFVKLIITNFLFHVGLFNFSSNLTRSLLAIVFFFFLNVFLKFQLVSCYQVGPPLVCWTYYFILTLHKFMWI